jgi:hypothetical protein
MKSGENATISEGGDVREGGLQSIVRDWLNDFDIRPMNVLIDKLSFDVVDNRSPLTSGDRSSSSCGQSVSIFTISSDLLSATSVKRKVAMEYQNLGRSGLKISKVIL